MEGCSESFMIGVIMLPEITFICSRLTTRFFPREKVGNEKALSVGKQFKVKVSMTLREAIIFIKN